MRAIDEVYTSNPWCQIPAKSPGNSKRRSKQSKCPAHRGINKLQTPANPRIAPGLGGRGFTLTGALFVVTFDVLFKTLRRLFVESAGTFFSEPQYNGQFSATHHNRRFNITHHNRQFSITHHNWRFNAACLSRRINILLKSTTNIEIELILQTRYNNKFS